MLRRLLACLLLAASAVSLALPAIAQEEERVAEVVELRGPLDSQVLAFARDTIVAAAERGDTEVVVIQLDSPGVTSGLDELTELLALVERPPLPVVVWVGPAPAVAQGGALQLLAAVPLGAVAPGSRVGYAAPTIAGGNVAPLVGVPDQLVSGLVTVEAGDTIPGVVDLTQPSLRQLIIEDLDGRVLPTSGGEVELSTLVPFTAEDGSQGVTNLPTVIREPGLWDSFLRLASRPEAAFFFLVAGLTVAVFEFYAIGPGIAAGVAAISLLLAGYGVAVLPIRGWALALTVVSVLAMAAAYQAGGVALLTGAGIAGLVVSGLWFTDAAPQITPAVPGVVLTVAASAFFFLLAMPTVARARFSTTTIGREGLIGRQGVAVTAFDPDGEVEVEGARWRATAHREAGIEAGDPVEVAAVDGWHLEVHPTEERENST